MDEFLGIVCIAAFALGFVVVVVYAIWQGINWLVGGGARPGRPSELGSCPACGAVVLTTDLSCRSCGSPLPGKGNRTGEALDALARHITRLQATGLIDSEASGRLMAAVREEQRQAAQIQPKPAPPVAPPPPDKPLTPTPDKPPVRTPTAAAPPSSPPAPRPSSDPATRAREFVARQEAAAEAELVQAEASADPQQPQEPSQPFTQLLSAFMEERNIRWGELVGGLLIVCGSLALVLSFWSKIANRPLLQFFAFNGVTAVLFGLGYYADRRMKLPTTGHGLLVIATMLVPLNFLALAAFTSKVPPTDLWTIVGEIVSIGLFVWLTKLAGETITRRGPWRLALGVLGPSAMALLVRRFVGPETDEPMLYGLAALPLMCYCAATGGMIWQARRQTEIEETDANEMFRLLGLTTFAALLPLGLLVARTEEIAGTLRQLAPLVSLAAAPALASGLMLWRRITDPELAGIRTAGTAIAVFATLVLLTGIALAWPNPAVMIPVAVVNFLLLTAIALLFNIPAAHLLATPCLVLAYLVGFHVVAGHIGWKLDHPARMAGQLLSATSGTALTPIALVLGAAAVVWLRRGRRLDAMFYAMVAGASAALSLVLVSWKGFGQPGDPAGATWVYALYAAGTLAAAWWIKQDAIRWAGSGLVLAALVQGIVFGLAGRLDVAQPWLLALLVHAAVMVATAIGFRRFRGDAGRAEGFGHSALVTSIVAAGFLTWAIRLEAAWFISLHALWIAAIWLVLAWLHGSAELFTAFQVALTATVVFGVAAAIRRQPWAGELGHPWLDPWMLQAQAIALAVLSFAWMSARIFVGHYERRAEDDDPQPTWLATASRLLRPAWPTCDRVMLAVALFIFVLLAIYAASPGVAQELCPRRFAAELERIPTTAPGPAGRIVPAASHFELPGLPHLHALGIGSWILLATLLAALLAGQWEKPDADLTVALLVLAGAFPLLAGRWEADVAAASAMRWLSAAFFAIASVAIWMRRPLLRWLGVNQPSAGLGYQVTALALALAFFPLVTMGLFVGITAVAHHRLDPALASTMQGLAVVMAVGVFVALALRGRAGGWFFATEPGQPTSNNNWARHASTLALVLGAGPLLAVALYVISTALKGNPIAGPEPGSFFHRIGLAASYALPVLLLAVTLVGYAVRERSPKFAFAAGLLFNAAGTMGYLFLAAKAGLKLDESLWVKIGQLNGAIAAGYALAWSVVLALSLRRDRDEDDAPRTHGLLITQTMLGVAINLILIVPGLVTLFLNPLPSAAHVALASPLGWAGAMLAVGSLLVLARATRTPLGVGAICAGMLLLSSLVTFTACRWDRSNWLGYHTMMFSQAAAGWLLLAGAWGTQPYRTLQSSTRYGVRLGVSLLGTLTVVLALREVVSNPELWWAIAAIGSMSLLAACLACWASRRGYLYIAGTLINLAASIGWYDYRLASGQFGEFFVELIGVNVIALALPVVVWLLIELRWIRATDTQPLGVFANIYHRTGIGFHRVAAVLAVIGAATLVGLGLFADSLGAPLDTSVWLGWLAVVATAVAVTACLWDAASKAPVARLYVLGLIAVGMALDQFNLTQPRMIAWTGTMILAAYAIATSYLWSRRAGLHEMAARLGVPIDPDRPNAGLTWLVPANGMLVTVVLTSAYAMILTFAEPTLRLAVGKAAVFQAFAVGMLARGERRSPLQYAALLVGIIGAVAWGWAWLNPGENGNLINYSVVVTVVLGVMTALYGLGPGKLFPRQTEWTRAAGRLVPLLAGLGVASILAVLGIEASYFLAGRDLPMAPAAIAAVALTLVGLAVAALIAALVPGRDPLGLSERGRTVYVYATEAFLALLFLHIRLSMPWLFRGFFTRYWPFIVVLIAFMGVGLAELFRRQKRNVLAEPLENTGAFLPLLPVLGFWITPQHGHYSVLMLLVGGLYAALSITRRSFAFGIVAALAANVALWYYLYQVDGYSLLEHPQLWLIPGSLCVLAAAYLNREQLSDTQMTTVRYLTSVTIYVSSTADIFINGVAEAWWLPLVLGGLSIAGIFLGIMLRVRAFLFLGTAFLVLALFTIIWHAAVDLHHTWLVWLTVVIVGVLIIAVFALFEKKRNEVLRVIEDLKKWDP